MGKIFLLLCTLFISSVNLLSQSTANPNHDADEIKGSWQINGSISDWEKLLGKSTGDPLAPFVINLFLESETLDQPEPAGDLRLTNFVYDEHNVYLYFRRLAVSSDPYTFTYYFDINANGLIEPGEPAVTATFTDKDVSDLTFAYATDSKSTLRTCYKWTTNVPIQEVFSSGSIPGEYELTNKEEFSAAVTEKGYGVELAIPWSYLRNWISGSRSLQKGEVFNYLLTIKSSTAGVNSDVWEGAVRVGTFNEEQTISEDIIINDTVITLIPNLSYRFALQISNESNLTAYINLQELRITGITAAEGFDATNIIVKRYMDIGCDGAVTGEQPFPIQYTSGTLNQLPILYHIPNLATMGKWVNGFGDKVCFIVDVTFNKPISSASIEIVPKLDFFPTATNPCTPHAIVDGGKPINPVGFTLESEFVARPLRAAEQQDVSSVSVYPNPSQGSIAVTLPKEEVTAVNLLDNQGRVVKGFGKINSRTLYLHELKNGVYYLQVILGKGYNQVLKKVVVQK